MASHYSPNHTKTLELATCGLHQTSETNVNDRSGRLRIEPRKARSVLWNQASGIGRRKVVDDLCGEAQWGYIVGKIVPGLAIMGCFEILESVEDEGGTSGHGSYCVGDEELESWGLKVSDSANAGDVSAPEETFQTWNGSDWAIRWSHLKFKRQNKMVFT